MHLKTLAHSQLWLYACGLWQATEHYNTSSCLIKFWSEVNLLAGAVFCCNILRLWLTKHHLRL